MHKVQEVAMMLGVSRVTVYKKIEQLKSELKNRTSRVNGALCVDDDGIEIIRAHLSNDHIRRAVSITHVIDEMDSAIENISGEQESIEDPEKNDLKMRLAESEKKAQQYKEGLIKALGSMKRMKKDYLDALAMMDEMLESQIQSKKRELDDKNRIITGYKQIIGYNKERISFIEEKLYTLFK